MAQKPKAPDWLIENIAEASKNARKIYFLYVSFLAYCAVTVVGTSDRQIILNETVILPILKLEVSLNGFFILAPLIAMLVFVYFQLYLHRLKGLTDDLRTNYASVEKRRLYPWMINIAEDPEPGVMGKLQTIIVKSSLWTLLPSVLFLIAIWFVKKHDPFLSYILGISPIIGTFLVLFFWCQHEDIKLKDFLRRYLKPVFIYIGLIIVSAILAILVFRVLLIAIEIPSMSNTILHSPWVIIGVFIVLCPLLRKLYLKLRGLPLKEEGKIISIMSLLIFEVLLLLIIIPDSNNGNFISVNLSCQNLVTEPKKDYKGLFWGDFNEAHLEGAKLINVILERADLRHAHLQSAVMYFAILEKANLEGANLEWAHLGEANLQEANLGWANLKRANLEGANLQGADLLGAKYLTIEQLSKVKTLYRAKLFSGLMREIEKGYAHLLDKPKPEK